MDGRRCHGANSRSWAEMAPDVLTNIFLRLSLPQLLTVIPLVCKPWKLAALDPLCYQILDLRKFRSPLNFRSLEVLLQRSQGRLLEFQLPGLIDHDCLYLVARSSAPLIQKLRIPDSFANDQWCIYAAPLMPAMTDLDLSVWGNKFSHLAVEAFGKNCKHISHLRRNSPHRWTPRAVDDVEAFAIAQHYPNLIYLELRRNPLSPYGLRAILDNCIFLEYLDLSRCPHVEPMDHSLWIECQTRLKVVGIHGRTY